MKILFFLVVIASGVFLVAQETSLISNWQQVGNVATKNAGNTSKNEFESSVDLIPEDKFSKLQQQVLVLSQSQQKMEKVIAQIQSQADFVTHHRKQGNEAKSQSIIEPVTIKPGANKIKPVEADKYVDENTSMSQPSLASIVSRMEIRAIDW